VTTTFPSDEQAGPAPAYRLGGSAPIGQQRIRVRGEDDLQPAKGSATPAVIKLNLTSDPEEHEWSPGCAEALSGLAIDLPESTRRFFFFAQMPDDSPGHVTHRPLTSSSALRTRRGRSACALGLTRLFCVKDSLERVVNGTPERA
jgi:hypothetical protein